MAEMVNRPTKLVFRVKILTRQFVLESGSFEPVTAPMVQSVLESASFGPVATLPVQRSSH